MVKGKNKKTDLEGLFRKVLDQSEITPGIHVGDQLMRRLARREFVRFNPARFNIYYLGGIVAAVVVTTLLLTTGEGHYKKADAVEETGFTIQANSPLVAPEQNEALQVQAGSNSGKDENNSIKNQASPVIKRKAGRQGAAADTETADLSRKNDLPGAAIRKTLVMDNLSDAGNNAVLQRSTVAAFEMSGPSGCVPLKVSFRNNSQAYDSCRWNFGDGGFSDATNPDWIYDRDGEFRVTLTVFGSDGVQESASSLVTVFTRPEARFEFQPDKPIIPDDPIRFINYSANAVKYKWDFGDGLSSDAFEPEHRYSKYGSYNVRLIAWSEHGCSDSVTITDAFAGSGCYIDFPNAFIPNPDGPSGGLYTRVSDEAAQIFHPVTSGVSEFQMRIFSKNGILIFESNDINIGWDGYHKGQLCEPGVYIWKVRGSYKNGEPFVKMGDITLLKR